MRSLAPLAGLLTLALALPALPSGGNKAPSQYAVAHLSSFGFRRVEALSDDGTVAGFGPNTEPFGGEHLLTWHPTRGLRDLGAYADNRWYFRLTEINDAGQILGTASSMSPDLKPIGYPFVIGSDGEMEKITIPEEVRSYSLAAMNGSGVVCGQVEMPTETGWITRGFRWSSAEGFEVLPALGGRWATAYDINDAGYMVGSAGTTVATSTGPVDVSHPVVWHPDRTIHDLRPDGVNASPDSLTAINNGGQVAGMVRLGQPSGPSPRYLQIGHVSGILGITEHQVTDVRELNASSQVLVGIGNWYPVNTMRLVADGVFTPIKSRAPALQQNEVSGEEVKLNDRGQVIVQSPPILLTPADGDAHAPTLTMISPAATAGSVVKNPAAIRGSLNDSSWYQWEMFLDGVLVRSGGGTGHQSLEWDGRLTPGNHKLQFRYQDEHLNITQKSYSFSVPSDPPPVGTFVVPKTVVTFKRKKGPRYYLQLPVQNTSPNGWIRFMGTQLASPYTADIPNTPRLITSNSSQSIGISLDLRKPGPRLQKFTLTSDDPNNPSVEVTVRVK